MNKITRLFAGTLITSIILLAFLSLFSLVLGWNLITSLAFWVILVPIIANFSAKIVLRDNKLIIAILGVLIFYSIVIFLIYRHSESDLFTVIKYSLFSSIFFLTIYNYDKILSAKSKA